MPITRGETYKNLESCWWTWIKSVGFSASLISKWKSNTRTEIILFVNNNNNSNNNSNINNNSKPTTSKTDNDIATKIT
jgi:hypothetical protein